jgi:hypothetical protein
MRRELKYRGRIPRYFSAIHHGRRESGKYVPGHHVIAPFPSLHFRTTYHETDGDGQSDERENAVSKVALNPDEITGWIIEVDNKEPDTPGNEQ